MNRVRTRGLNPHQRDFTLMTVLAYDDDSFKKAQELLKKYNREPATCKRDLEDKLAKLYFSTDINQRLELEKEMANIHPHSAWILKRLAPEPKIEIKEVEVPKKEEKTSKAEGQHENCPLKNYSYCAFNGKETTSAANNNKQNYMELVAIIAIVGLVVYATKK